MKIWIVTPSYNQIGFLKRCVASVRDQADASIVVHHHVQDARSNDGTAEWLRDKIHEMERLKAGGELPHYSFSFASEPDEGMYDAINRGWRLAGADVDVLAHLNCDEQYLRNALSVVSNCFLTHADADVILADMIVVDGDGEYVCHRRSIKPHKWLTYICCPAMTTTTFQRAAVVREQQVLFDPSWRNIGDMVWYNDLHRAGTKFRVCNQLVAVFTDTGDNLNLDRSALEERARYAKEHLRGCKFITRLCSKLYSLRRYIKEFSLSPPREYRIYWRDTESRDVFAVSKPTGLWHRDRPAGD